MRSVIPSVSDLWSRSSRVWKLCPWHTQTVVEDDDISVNEIGVGSIIKIKDIELDEIEDLQIVGSTESDP